MSEVEANIYTDKYNKYKYKGLSGYISNKSHAVMEQGVNFDNKRVLEIGGAAHPHLKWMDISNLELYIISDTSEVIGHARRNNSLAKLFKLHIFEDDPDYRNLSSFKFTRIIVSHVWEHLKDPEDFLIKWYRLLDEEGTLSISLPCDPGFLWRAGQLIKKKDYVKLWGRQAIDYDLLMTREHINAAQRLKRILNYYCPKKKWRFFPFKFIPLVEFNLQISISVKKSDFLLE